MAEEKIIDIEELQQDKHNFNQGTKKGKRLMARSLQELGAVRSILLDKDNNIIAGNKTQEAAIKAGIKKVRIIETTGDELVAVKRTDVDIDSVKGRELALVDNLASQVNLSLDEVELSTMTAELNGFDPNNWGLEVKGLTDQQFEQEFNSVTNDDAEYPIIPKYDEKHELFIIISDNEVDANYLREVLNMQKMKSYKSGKVTKSNVVHIKDVINELKNRNPQS